MKIRDLPSDEDLLAEYAEPDEDIEGGDSWALCGGGYTSSREGILNIIKMCLLLDRRVTPVITSDWSMALVTRLLELEDRVDRLSP